MPRVIRELQPPSPAAPAALAEGRAERPHVGAAAGAWRPRETRTPRAVNALQSPSPAAMAEGRAERPHVCRRRRVGAPAADSGGRDRAPREASSGGPTGSGPERQALQCAATRPGLRVGFPDFPRLAGLAGRRLGRAVGRGRRPAV
jgi:hypothetical protein